MKIKPLIIAAWLALPGCADSLLESYQAALEHDKLLQSAYYDTQIADARRRQTVANLLPSLFFTAGVNVDKYSRYDKHFDESYKNYGVSLRQQVFRPSLWMAAKSEARRQTASEYAYENAKSELALRLSAAYFEYLFSSSRAELAASFHEANQTRLEQIRKSFKEGLVSKMDFLEAKIRADKSFLELSKARKDEQTARLALANITGKDPGKMPKITGLKTEYFEHQNPEQFLNISSNLEYKQLQIASEIAGYEVQSRQADFLPQVDFSMQFSDNRYQDERYFGDKRNQFNARLSVNWPLFTSGFMQARLQEARLERLKSLAKQQNAADEISLKQQKALNEFKNALEEVKLSGKSLEHAELYEQAMERSHELGLKDLVELLDARARAYEARAAAIKSASALVSSYLQLEALVGNVNEGVMKELSEAIY